MISTGFHGDLSGRAIKDFLPAYPLNKKVAVEDWYIFIPRRQL
jgi:hypothetical protein